MHCCRDVGKQFLLTEQKCKNTQWTAERFIRFVAVSVLNYHVYHTYSMAPGAKNDPIVSLLKLEARVFFEDKEREDKIDRLLGKPIPIIVDCKPPSHLLAKLGFKSPDAYDIFHLFKQFRPKVDQIFSEVVNSSGALAEISIDYAATMMFQQSRFKPSKLILISCLISQTRAGNGRNEIF